MSQSYRHPRTLIEGTIAANAPVSTGLLRLDLDLRREVVFSPGQFAMLNLTGNDRLVFSRPFSILAVEGTCVSFLYRVVGRGTDLLARSPRGSILSFFGPLGTPFGPPDDGVPVVLLAGGVGLPPLFAWWQQYARTGDRAYFGARECGDVPWDLLADQWRISVDERPERLPPGRDVFTGLVTELCAEDLAGDSGPRRQVLSCGPLPLLRAAYRWAQARRWGCLVSVEEHMGCGYGVCKGCVVPLRVEASGDDDTPRHATSCQEGPVFDGAAVDWARFGRRSELP